MKKTTKLAMAQLCPFQKVKRPMSRNAQTFQHFGTLMLGLLFTCITLTGKAQTQPLKGRITDQQNNPLVGATLTENLTKTNTQTAGDGTFTLKTTTQTGKVTVTFLGYQSQTLDYATDRPLNIQLTEDLQTLQTVVINTGYYSVSQKQLTGSISTVKAEQIEKQPISNPLLAMQGRVTGAYIQQTSSIPGSTVNLIIRGQNSLDAGSQPLYLVDGVPFGSQSLSSTISAGNFGSSGTSPFATLSPEDIQGIDILKDADATAIYGSRGANGVVLITTKKGKSGKTTIDISSFFGASSLSHTIEMMDTENYLNLRRTAFALDNTPIKATDYDLNGTWDQSRNINWQKEILGGNANLSNTKIAVSGGSQNSQFYLSAARQTEGTITSADNKYARYSAHLSASLASTNQKFRATASVSYSADKTNWTNSEIAARAINLAPDAPELFNPDGSLNWANSTWSHPLAVFNSPYLARNNNLIGNINLSYEPIKNLRVSLAAGYTTSALNDKSYTPVAYYDPAEGRTPATSLADFNATTQNSIIAEPQLGYQLDTKFGSFSFLTGMSIQQQQREQLITRGAGFASDAMIENIKAATSATISAYNTSTYRYSGIYGRIGYTLKERYTVNLTARRDGSSRFGTENRIANFGAIGIAYLASETKFFKKALPFISLAKIRGSYGSAGNDQIGDYEYLNTYQAATAYNGVASLSPVRLFNPDFGWEKNTKAEVGLELGFFRDRLRAQINYYHNISTSQLIDYPLAATTGFTSIRNNLDAKVLNTGLELEIAYSQTSGRLKWETSINYTVPRNRLLEFPGLSSSSYAGRYVIGRSLGIGKVYRLLGVDPQTGVYTYEDFNKDGVISTLDRQVIVDRGQKGYGGRNNSFTYKQFELSFLFQFVFQKTATFRSLLTIAPGRIANQPMANVGKYWTKPGDIAELQRPTTGGNATAQSAYTNYATSDAATADASFARLKNLSLSYRNKTIIPGKTIRLFDRFFTGTAQ